MSRSFRLSLLSDNCSSVRGLGAEFGFSVFVETPGANLLFDCGSGSLFSDNARALGLELFGVESIVLSHGHCDHCDGLPRALFEAPKASLVLREAALEPRMRRDSRGRMVSIGPSDAAIRAAREAVDDGRGSFIEGPVRLGPNALVIPCGPREELPPSWPYFVKASDGSFQPDRFADELCLLILGSRSAALFVPDAHNGFASCRRRALPYCEGLPLTHIVAGFRPDAPGQGGLDALSNLLRETGASVVLCHGAGMEGFAALRSKLGRAVMPGYGGLGLDLDL